MSKAVGKIFGGGAGASTSMYGGEQEILNYLNNYNTANYDTTLNNLTAYAANASNRLAGMGDYQFNVAASDDARQRAEQAVYQSYVDKLQPQFANQTSDLAASLANKGISVGSEAYSRAMTDLQNNQNNALNQAAYQSVLAGQEAYSNSLGDQIASAGFSNTAQSSYINQLLQALQNSYSGYDIAMDKYGIKPDIYWTQVIYYSFSMIMLVIGLSYITATLVGFFRDLGQVMNIILQFGMWLTPIMWQIDMIPGNLMWLFKLNPMYYVVQGYRDSLIYGVPFYNNIKQTLYFWMVVMVLMLIGSLLYRRLKPHFADVL